MSKLITQIDRLAQAVATEFSGKTNAITALKGLNVVKLEGLKDTDRMNIQNVQSQIDVQLESVIEHCKMKNNEGKDVGLNLNAANIEAGRLAALYASDPSVYGATRNSASFSMEGIDAQWANTLGDGLVERSLKLEAFEEADNRAMVMHAIVYNMLASKQDEAMETIWPTYTLPGDQAGFSVRTSLMLVFAAVERRLSGEFVDWNKRHIVRAIADETILKKKVNLIVPRVRAQTVAMFCDPLLVAPAPVVVDGESINTAPLAFGLDIDMLTIGATDAMISGGILDSTDSLDRQVIVDAMLVKFGNDIVKFNVGRSATALFTPAQQGNYKALTLNMDIKGVLMNKDTKTHNGGALVTLADVVTDDLLLKFRLEASGRANTETGELNVRPLAIKLMSVQDAAGVSLPLTSGQGAAIKAIVDAATFVGFEPIAYRTNINRRQMGDLIDTTHVVQNYVVPFRSPVSAVRPAQDNMVTDNSDIAALITYTAVAMRNEGVGALLSTFEHLSQYVDARDVLGDPSDMFGIGRHFVRPTLIDDDLNVLDATDGIRSADRRADIRAAIVNKLCSMFMTAYLQSEFQPAYDVLSGGIAPLPTAVMLTDPYTASYLNIDGETRLFGQTMETRVVTTWDRRVRGTILGVFGIFDGERNTQIHPLQFGNCVWAPENVLVGKYMRNGSHRQETAVQARYGFYNHCPVGVRLALTNLETALGKLAIHNHPV